MSIGNRTNHVTTIQMYSVPNFIRELHELVLDDDEAAQTNWTDKACSALFEEAAELFPNIHDLRNVESLQLVYTKPEDTVDDYYYNCY